MIFMLLAESNLCSILDRMKELPCTCRAALVYPTPKLAEMREACIDQDLSWAKPARKWEAVLEEMAISPSVDPSAIQRKAAVTTPVNTPKEAGRRATGTVTLKS